MGASMEVSNAPGWSVTKALFSKANASDNEISTLWYAHVSIFLQLTLAVSGYVVFKWGMPAFSFASRLATAPFVDGDSNDEWEMTKRRSKEVKEQQKRLNEEKEKERHALKAAERERRKKKEEEEQKRLDVEYQSYLAQQEIREKEERDQKKRDEKKRKDEEERSKREAEDERTRQWVTNRQRREQ